MPTPPCATALACAAGVVAALAAPAAADPFAVVSYLAGAQGYEFGGFQVSHQGFFDADGVSEPRPPLAADFTEWNNYEFDSYFALDGFGPSARGRATDSVFDNSYITRAFYGDYPAPSDDPGLGDHNAFFGILSPGSHIGDPMLLTGENILRADSDIVSVPTITTSGFAPQVGGGRSDLDGVFIARLTIPQNASLSGGFTITINTGIGESEEGFLQLSGVDNVSGSVTMIGGQPMALTAFLITQHAGGVLVGKSDQNAFSNFGAARTLDLWAHVVPTPSALALLGLAGLASSRRRRAG